MRLALTGRMRACLLFALGFGEYAPRLQVEARRFGIGEQFEQLKRTDGDFIVHIVLNLDRALLGLNRPDNRDQARRAADRATQ